MKIRVEVFKTVVIVRSGLNQVRFDCGNESAAHNKAFELAATLNLDRTEFCKDEWESNLTIASNSTGKNTNE
jgi:hypothetical protein